MDHIPHPQNAIPLRVPYLPHLPDYDTSDGHHYFPEGHPYYAGAEFPDRTATVVASFAQSFLYFGLLSDVLEKQIDPRILVETSSDGEFVSSKKLKPLILSHLKEKTWAEIYSRVDDLLSSAREKLEMIERIRSPRAEPLPTVLLSIGILIDTLSFTLIEGWTRKEYYGEHITPTVPGELHAAASAGLLEVTMKQNKWCPAHIHRALSRFPYGLCYYLSRFSRYSRLVQSKGDQSEGDHKKCSTEQCKAYSMNPNTYVTAHRPGCTITGCDLIEVAHDKAATLVSEGKIPLISISRDSNGKITLEAKASEYNDIYVAISHVWSDGMGNKTINALPTCQLESISCFISEVPGLPAGTQLLNSTVRQDRNRPFKGRLFWIDTLCVPLNPVLKKLAINAIPAVYSGATQVLVLDREMEQLALGDLQWLEIAGRLAFSAWTGRCWTLEEAGFSHRCCVRLADRTFDPRGAAPHRGWFDFLKKSPFLGKEMRRAKWQLLRAFLAEVGWLKIDADYKLNRKFDIRLNAMLGKPLDVFYKEIFARTWKKEDDTDDELFQKQFLHTWNSLGGRQTSVEEDKLTIFIHMLDLNPFEVMGAPSARLPKSAKSSAGKDVEQAVSVSEMTGPKQLEPPTKLKMETAMKKIVKSIDFLPLALLYNDGPRARPEEDHDYRWLPLYPSTEELDQACFMAWQDGGLHFGNDKRNVNLSLFTLKRPAADTPELILTTQTKTRTMDSLRVRFLRQPGDKMAGENPPAMAIVLERASGPDKEIRGACLRVSGSSLKCSCPPDSRFPLVQTHVKDCEDRTPHLQCVYDCPVRARTCRRSSGEPEPADIPRIGRVRLSEWEATLRCDTTGRDVRLQRRPPFASTYAGLVLVIPIVPFGLMSVVGGLLLIIIAATSFRDLAVGAQVCTVLYFCVGFIMNLVMALNVYGPFAAVVIAAAYGVIEGRLRPLTKLEISFLVLVITGNLFQGLMRACLRFFVERTMYNEWIKTYTFSSADDWETTFKAKWNTKAYHVYSRGLNWVRRIKGT